MSSGVSKNKPEFLFAFPSYEDWLEAARQELEGADPIEKLTIKKGNLVIEPFYTSVQKQRENQLPLRASVNPYQGARSWTNTPKILVTDEKKANEIALSYLNSGAEGILFECPSREIDPVLLLKQISLVDCSVSFLLSGTHHAWITKFQQLAESDFNVTEIKGGFFWRSIPDQFADIAQRFTSWPQFNALGIIVEPQEDPAVEIGHCLKKAAMLVNESLEKNIEAQIVLDQISFSVSVGTDFFLEIAKLKSLRHLWTQVRGAYDVNSAKPLHIHVTSPVWINDKFQPHGNLIKSTTASMAAIAGGCDSITVEPEDATNETMNRMARNVSSILRDESHFSKVADPTAGSYYIDSLTEQLSEKAWSNFQSLMK
jgi:methylmalonyl-CoA mutase